MVDHAILAWKLGHAGICGSLLRWCESYLLNRSQLVIVRGFKSTAREVPSGVPQGSHLGPLFFLVFINDLCTTVTSRFKLFADDLKIYREIHSRDDVTSLQADLSTIGLWCYKNKMVLNASKCFHIKFTRKRNFTNAVYYINGSPLDEVSSIRDLGVIVDQKLDFREHIDHIAKKGARLAGFVIRQTKTFKEPEIPIILFNCYVRSLLEYCSPIWSPSYAVHINRIERLQKKFIYHLTYANNRCRSLTSYDSRLQHYNMFPLDHRRKTADIVFLHKIINGIIDSPDILHKIQLSVPRVGSRLNNRKTFLLPSCRTNYSQHSSLYRLCSYYNGICNDLDIFNASAKTIKNFMYSKL